MIYTTSIPIKAAAKNRDDYKNLTMDLTSMVEDLEKHLRESRSAKVPEYVESVV
jgi:hypothetical protein